MDAPPDCDCFILTGAHDERCAHVKHVRSEGYAPDVKIPAFLIRRREPAAGGMFD